MKLALLGLGLTLGLLHSPLSAQSSVWKVSKGDASIYLGGTCHVLRPKDFPLPKEYDQAFAAAAKVYFETDLARVRSPEMQKIVMEQGMFTDGTTLDKVLSPAAWANVQDYATANKLPPAQIARMKPWFFIVMITMVELHKVGVSMEGVDVHYFNLLQSAGKKAGELEAFEDHIKFVTTMGAGHESEMLENSLEELKELPSLIENILGAWKSGDLASLDKFMVQETKAKYPSVYQALLVDRNRNWMPRIEAMFATPEVELVLVGAAHLAGSDGLIAQLKSRGYQIEQIKAP